MSEQKHTPTSASNFHRRMRCPGSHAAELGLMDEDSEVSAMGVLLHSIYTRHMMGENVAVEMGKLTPDNLRAVNMAIDLTHEVINQATSQRGIPENAPREIFSERELYFRKGLKILFTGHCDIGVWFPTYKMLIIVDAKFGYLLVEHASGNMQTRCYAVQCQPDYPEAEETIVALVQPRHPKEDQISMASYTSKEIEASRQQILSVWESIMDPDAIRCAGDHCNYCKAKLACSTHTEQMGALEKFGKVTDISTVNDDQMLALYKAFKLATNEKFKDALNTEMKKRILEGRYKGRLELKPGKNKRFITCTSQAFKCLDGRMSWEGICESLKGFSLTTLAKVFHAEKKSAGQKCTNDEAKQEIEAILKTVIGKGQDQPSIVAVKGALE